MNNNILNNSYGTLINITYFDPAHSLFKFDKSEREYVKLYYCNNCENCDAYKKNCCIMLNVATFSSMHTCPYGKEITKEGYTRSAMKYGQLLHEYKSNYKDFCYKLKNYYHPCKIGDYWYLNTDLLGGYKHRVINGYGNLPEDKKKYQTSMTDYFKNNLEYKDMIHIDKFNSEFFNRLIDFEPFNTWTCKVVPDYKEKYLPEFLYGLRKSYPDVYSKIVSQRPEAEDFTNKVSFKDRQAKLITLSPGDVNINGKKVYWDGEKIVSTANYLNMWGNLNDAEVTIKPTENSIVKIIDNATVNDDTEFI